MSDRKLVSKRRHRVYCAAPIQCGWKGYRISDRLGVQPASCPRCEGQVVR